MSVDRQVEKYVSCSNLRTLWNLVIIRWAKDYGWAPVTATPTSTSHSRSGKRSKEENSSKVLQMRQLSLIEWTIKGPIFNITKGPISEL